MNAFSITANGRLGAFQDHPTNHVRVSTLRGE
jgi:hypothetical protein